MWHEDLSTLGHPRFVAVGWLERGHEYPTGLVATDVFAKLESLVADPWQPSFALGPHDCDLCVYKAEKSGTANVFIPGEGHVYVAPELILHYMNVHDYQPPVEFCEAVMRCPPTRSMEYLRALLAAGGPDFVRHAQGALAWS